jgi:hypothetical protein
MAIGAGRATRRGRRRGNPGDGAVDHKGASRPGRGRDRSPCGRRPPRWRGACRGRTSSLRGGSAAGLFHEHRRLFTGDSHAPTAATRTMPLLRLGAGGRHDPRATDAGGVRYLHCSLCSTAWNHVRAVCITCGSSRGVTLKEVEGGCSAVKAETCDECRTYAKMLYQAQDMQGDPYADDLASLGLDILVAEAGWSRHALPLLVG